MASPLIILSFFILSFSAPSYSSNQTDITSLLALKQAIHFDPNGALNTWNRTTNFCRWNGITCGRKHPDRVVAIDFDSQGMMGSLSPHIGNLSFLRSINLRENSFDGPIPQEIGLLRRLQFLRFDNNSFSGTIPENISMCKNLVYLNLIDNKLSGNVPPQLGFLYNLQSLYLSANTFSGRIPRSIGNLTSLKHLSLAACGLNGEIPESLARLSNLTFLQLGGNNLTGTIPPGLFNISTIYHFGVDSNNLHGSIPSTIGRTLPNLKLLGLAQNQFSGSIPISLANASLLEELALSLNSFTGLMPRWFGKTQVHGKIPPGIGNLDGLTYLNLRENYLEGPIPLSIGRLFNLQFLDMTGNNLSGAIPKSIGNCANLLEIYLSRNSLSGFIPRELMNLPSISVSLDLSNNAFTGPIPDEVGSLQNLAFLDFSNNRLSGVIPNSLGMCISLEQLHLEGNLFEGQISQGLSSLMGLRNLDLSRNNLSGTIPSFLGTLRLQQLNLSFNRLQGEVPTTGVFKNKSEIFLQGNGKLCGGVPELNFPSCTSKKNLSTPLKIAIPIAGVALLATSLSSPPSSIGGKFPRLSYSDLLKSTSGFSENNLVGRGRFGSVFKGILDDGLIVVAVKVLNLDIKGASKSFTAECNALRGIRHRNLVKMLSVCESIDFQGNDFKALVYEFKANGSLDKWLDYNGDHKAQESDARLRNLDVIERLKIAIDVAHALEYLHCGTDSTIVHGDLKPSNILLDEDMTACVGDFGLAKIISSILPQNQSSSSIGIKGTFGYVPPEYGTSNSVSTKGDVYSYGILVLEIFTNKRPTDDSFMDHINLHNFVEAALPDRVMEIVDPHIRIGPHQNDNNKFEDCMCSIFSIGLSCSKELPRERKSMADVVNELHKIQKELCPI
ncbi:hypothetical protein MIMGU_mgv1a018813mg [Erythranthe guttata]|uniref:non-specific serine/threonine protein kinase n=1 Tax=Erythranthe guttata TaxID=4155 RepID=A0A022RPW6_ERYGU|nr:hypothetical protein MIMGU_mgv1a018813mg [Erythranthe guttata]